MSQPTQYPYSSGSAPTTPAMPGRSESPYRAVPGVTVVPSCMVMAVLATVLGCWPVGIFAIVAASKARGKAHSGDAAGALAEAARSKRLSWISFGIAAALFVLLIALSSAGGGGSGS